jgi:sigma-B regulation protein RsbU (phosphoserine phosphatase)
LVDTKESKIDSIFEYCMKTSSQRARRPLAPYVALTVLFLGGGLFLSRFAYFAFGFVVGADPAREPFSLDGTDQRGPIAKITSTEPEAEKAGLKQGDFLLAVNEQPMKGLAVLGEAVRQHRPGDTLQLKVLSTDAKGNATQHTVALRLAHFGHFHGAWAFLFLYLSQYFCFALGFWVTLARPQDPRAWFLLLLLLSFSCFMNPWLTLWGPGLRDLGSAYRHLLTFSAPMWLLWLGIYFPEPFPRQGLWRVWYWLAWPFTALVAIPTLLVTVNALGALENLVATEPLRRIAAPAVQFILVFWYFGIAVFPVCMLAKWRTAQSRDSRRRLRLLAVGSIASIGPLLILHAIALATHKNIEIDFPRWLWISTYVLISLFPVTLAYVILVQRAMDVRIVLRQGLQYALARRSVVMMQVLLTAVVIYAGATVAIQKLHRTPVIMATVVALGFVTAFIVGRGAQPLRLWVDRKFFRDAYNAEQILTELSETVRTIVERQPLLALVSQRITESLHVTRLAVFLSAGSGYRPAYAVGLAEEALPAFRESDGTIQHLRGERQPVSVYLEDAESWVNRDDRITPEERTYLEALKCELLLPLTGKDELLGFISLGPKRSEEPYSGSDVRLLKSVAGQTGLALEVARLSEAITQEIAQRERLNREIEIAREVQEHLFPKNLPVISGLDYCGQCRPALVVGGDYFDFLPLADGKLGIAIADISGKGISAALMMAGLQASLRSQAAIAPHDLGELVTRVNGLMYEASSPERYATFFYAEYEPATRALVYVNAGHNPPIVLRRTPRGSVFERLEPGGTVVGLLPECSYQQSCFQMHEGDVLVGFTDGFTEAMNANGELWGEEQLMRTLATCDGLPSREIVARITAAADQFVGTAKQSDDMTVIAARVAG